MSGTRSDILIPQHDEGLANGFKARKWQCRKAEENDEVRLLAARRRYRRFHKGPFTVV